MQMLQGAWQGLRNPLAHGSSDIRITAENFATDSVKPGTYTINGILTTDWAGNTTYVQDPGQIKSLFGSSTFHRA